MSSSSCVSKCFVFQFYFHVWSGTFDWDQAKYGLKTIEYSLVFDELPLVATISQLND